MEYEAVSSSGLMREHNEDNYLVITEKPEIDLIAVADGMGGHNAGEVASSLAIKVVENYKFSSKQIVEDVKSCIKKANSKIWEKAQQKDEYEGMGTTLTLGVVKDKILTVGHVGDSRIYLYRKGELSPLTEDHSYAARLAREDLISQQEADNHPKRNVLLRALGIKEEVEIYFDQRELTPKDLLLFCSDGLTEMVAEKEIISILNKESIDLSEKTEQLVKLANKAGGRDNITVVLSEFF